MMQKSAIARIDEFLQLPKNLQIEVLKHLPWRELLQQSVVSKAHQEKVEAAICRQASIELYTEFCKNEAPEKWIRLIIQNLFFKCMTDAFNTADPALPSHNKAAKEQILKANKDFTNLVRKLIAIATQHNNTIIHNYLKTIDLTDALNPLVEKKYLTWLIRKTQTPIAIQQAVKALNTITDVQLRQQRRIEALDCCIEPNAFGRHNQKRCQHLFSILESDIPQADQQSVEDWITANITTLQEILTDGLNTKEGYTTRPHDDTVRILLKIVYQATTAGQRENFIDEVCAKALENHYLVVFTELFESPVYDDQTDQCGKAIVQAKCGELLYKACSYYTEKRMDTAEYLAHQFKPISGDDGKIDGSYLNVMAKLSAAANHKRGLALFESLFKLSQTYYAPLMASENISFQDLAQQLDVIENALLNGNETITQWLLEDNLLDLKSFTTTSRGLSALHCFVVHGQLDMIKANWTELANSLETKDKQGNTPIRIAARFLHSNYDHPNRHEIFEFLIEKGADLTVVNEEQATLLHDLVPENHSTAYIYNSSTFKDDFGIYPRTKDLEFFLPHLKVHINVRDKSGKTVLDRVFDKMGPEHDTRFGHHHEKRAQRWLPDVKLLLDNGAVCTKFEQLELLLGFKWWSVTDKIISNPESVKAFNKTPTELLDMAVQNGLVNMVGSILNNNPGLATIYPLKSQQTIPIQAKNKIFAKFVQYGAQITAADLGVRGTLDYDKDFVRARLASGQLDFQKMLSYYQFDFIISVLSDKSVTLDISDLLLKRKLIQNLVSETKYSATKKQHLAQLTQVILQHCNLQPLNEEQSKQLLQHLVPLLNKKGDTDEQLLARNITLNILGCLSGLTFDKWGDYDRTMAALEKLKAQAISIEKQTLINALKQKCTAPTDFPYNDDTVTHLNNMDNTALTDVIVNNSFADVDKFMADNKLKTDIKEMFSVKKAWQSIIDTIQNWRKETGNKKAFRPSYNKMWQAGNEVRSVQKMMNNYFVWWTYFIHPKRHHRDLARKLFERCKADQVMTSEKLLKTLYEFHGQLLAKASVNKNGSFRRRLLKCISEVEQKVPEAERQLVAPSA